MLLFKIATEIKPIEPVRVMPDRDRGILIFFGRGSICGYILNAFAMLKQGFIFGIFLATLTLELGAQSLMKVQGKVIDGLTEKYLPFATVSAQDTVVICDEFGQFSMVTAYPKSLVAAYIGYDVDYSGANIIIEEERPDGFTRVFKLYPVDVCLPTVPVTALRASEHLPVTSTNIKGAYLQEFNFGEDMPMLLESTPSAVATSDAGNGVGYTGLRIRGSDATRVNITINGVPYNDAESQQTYWVNLPDFASSVDDIQIQRGVGLSTNGVSSFGATININTNTLNEKSRIIAEGSLGSFGLRKGMLHYQSGRFADHWFVEMRLSDVYTDGYIDRAYADLSSQFFTLAYRGKITSIVNVFTGRERTYQAWGGVPAEVLDTNRTYNPYTYENQIDNYGQTHVQWHTIYPAGFKGEWRLTLNYTAGKGYYEQLEEDQDFAAYNTYYPVINSDTIFTSDLITQKWLDNDFSGAYLQYKSYSDFFYAWVTGASLYRYTGDHFGKVIWSTYAEPFGYDYTWYSNDAVKYDGNIFSQMSKAFGPFIAFADMQVRLIQYQFEGYDAYANQVDQQVDYLFFNPKVGITYQSDPSYKTYLFLGRAVKEPNRDDFVESTPLSRPSPEKMINLELGQQIRLNGWEVAANYYLMYYQDQLVLTGELNDVGAYTRTNVPESYRTGIELAWSKKFWSRMNWNANISYSQNRIRSFTAFVDDWDTGGQIQVQYANTAIGFSPDWIGYSQFRINCIDRAIRVSQTTHRLDLDITSKYVGAQYIDNTESAERRLNPYFVQDAGLRYTRNQADGPVMQCSFVLQNILDNQYESNAWVYTYVYNETPQQMLGYYPQAGRNWALLVRLSF